MASSSMSRSSLSRMANDYANLRTIPAMLSILYAVAGAYQFGAISDVTVMWLGGTGGYTLTAEHAVLVSLAAYAAAFASSETREFTNYETWEQVAIFAAPVTILGVEYVTEINDFFVGLGDPLGMQIAFLLSLGGWMVAVQ